MFTKNKIGVATWTLGKRPLHEIAQLSASLNFASVSLQVDTETATAAEIMAPFDDSALEISALTPQNVDLATADATVRQAALDHYFSLLDLAAELGCPTIVCQGLLGRTQPETSLEQERNLFITAVSQLAERAHAQQIRLALNVVNRYESHLFNSCQDALTLVNKSGADNVGVSLGAFHMNIEEQDPAAAINAANGRLFLYHVSDSNRKAIGRGCLKLGLQLWALENIGYDAPIIVECLPPHADSVTPSHDDDALQILKTYLQESRSWF